MNILKNSQGGKILPNYLDNKQGRWFRMLYFGLVALMILALIVVGLSIWNNIYLKSRSTLAPHANTLAERMSRFLTFEQEVLLSTADQFNMADVLSSKARESIANLARVSKQMVAIAVLDKDSNVLISNGDNPDEDWTRLF